MKKFNYCIDCKKELNRLDAKRCKKCYILWLKNNSKFFNHPDRFGSKNPNFNKDNTHNNKCIVCKKKISKNAIRCQSCAGKERFKNNIKKKYFCKDCGTETKNRYSKYCRFCCHDGNRNGNWKNGLSTLSLRIRTSEKNKKWLNNILKRDNYTCKKCNQRGGDLEVHHIKSFTRLINEFLKEYNQFSPYKDKEKLVRLAMNYNKFWNLDNGITLCCKCHKNTFNLKGKP